MLKVNPLHGASIGQRYNIRASGNDFADVDAVDNVWKCSDAVYRASLKTLGSQYGVRTVLNEHYIGGTQWLGPALKHIAAIYNPLHRAIVSGNIEDRLVYWELISQCLDRHIHTHPTDHNDATTRNIFSRVKIFTTFHIGSKGAGGVHDNAHDNEPGSGIIPADGSEVLSDTVGQYIANNADSGIEWRWESTVGLHGADRAKAWTNRILTRGGHPDVVVSALHMAPEARRQVDVDVPLCIRFAVENVMPGGDILIHLPYVSAAMLPTIQLAVQSFEHVDIMHTVAGDRLYLWGRDRTRVYDRAVTHVVDGGIIVGVHEAIVGARQWRYDWYARVLEAARVTATARTTSLIGGSLGNHLAVLSKGLGVNGPVDMTTEWANACKYILKV